jgi:hypothetical protein
MTRLADLKQQFQALAKTIEYLEDYIGLTRISGDKRLIATWEKAIANIQQFINDQQERGNIVTKQEYTPSTSVEQSDDETIDVQTTAEPTAPVCEHGETKANTRNNRLTIPKVKQLIRELFETDEDYNEWLRSGYVGNKRLLQPWVNFYLRTNKLITMAGSSELSSIRKAENILVAREVSDTELRIAVRDAILSEEALTLATEAIEEEHQCAETSNDEVLTTLDKETEEHAEPSVPRRIQRRAAAFFRNLRGTSKDGCNRIPFYAQPYDLRGAIQRQPMQVHFRHTEGDNSLHKVGAVM